MSRWRSALAASLLALPAANAGWDTQRVSSPESVTELRALQDRVKATTARVTPSTVGLLVGFGAGSGVIVSDDGLILTAAHVLGKPGAKVMVVMADGTKVRAVALGLDVGADSGMAKITDPVPEDARWPGARDGKWPKAELGDSAALKKGQWVISLGHHGGPRPERTPPLRVGRFEYASSGRDKILRSDCTLVGGDSGGPLFDLDGKVVGIHSKIGMFIDQNMHVPVDVFKDEWAQLKSSEDIGKKPASLGVDLDPDSDTPTLFVVNRRSAAYRAGLREGDVIVRIEGEAVATRDDVKKVFKGLRAGQEVEIDVRRNGKTVSVTVELGGKP